MPKFCQNSDLVLNPTNNNKLETIKTSLINTFANSVSEKIKKLLTDREITVRKPSQLLPEIKNTGTRQSERRLSKNIMVALIV